MRVGQLARRDVEQLAERQHVVQNPRDRVGGRRVAEGEVFQRHQVVGARQHLARRRRSIPPGSADLLCVVLQTLRHVVVVHVADVRLVDAHAEGDRRHDDLFVGTHKRVLHPVPMLGVHARVIRDGVDAGAVQVRRDLLSRALQGHVDDRRTALALHDVLNEQARPRI